MKTVVLVGCGNIGFRHLQAMASSKLASSLRMIIVEPAVQLHERISSECETADFADFEVLTSLPRLKSDIDLCVVATNANVRRALVEDLLDKQTVKTMILEKVLFQTDRDLKEIGALLKEKNVEAHVNCGRRGFAGYQKLAEMLRTTKDVTITVRGHGYAMASNGIHLFDLGEFLTGEALVEIDASGLDDGFETSKRSGYYEVFGTLLGRFGDNSTIAVTCENSDGFSLSIHVKADDLDVTIVEADDEIVFVEPTAKVEPLELRHVSQMPDIYDALLTGKECPLVSYSGAKRQHSLFINALRPHFELSNSNDDPCPIS